MAFGSAVHGINGLAYISGTEVFGAHAFSLAETTQSAEYIKFGDSFLSRAPGWSDWSGTLTVVHDQDAKLVQDCVNSRATQTVILYPKRSDLTTYYTGSAVFSEFGHTVDRDSIEGITVSFAGHSTLTPTGFTT